MSAKSRDGAIYAYGYANNCLEFVGNGITLWYNPCATVNGKMCSVPKDTDVDIYLWDYAYPFIVWDGVFYYCIGDSTPL